MLANGETKDIGGTGKSETVDGDIVGDLVLLAKNKVLELGGIQDLAGGGYGVLAQFFCI